jgi:hypothetical protein
MPEEKIMTEQESLQPENRAIYKAKGYNYECSMPGPMFFEMGFRCRREKKEKKASTFTKEAIDFVWIVFPVFVIKDLGAGFSYLTRLFMLSKIGREPYFPHAAVPDCIVPDYPFIIPGHFSGIKYKKQIVVYV